MNDQAPPMKPTPTPEMIEAACAAVILGEDEDGNPVHLQPSEAEAALSAALSVPAAAVVGEPITPHQFAQEYEFRGDTDYTPNDGERTMIEDAICGYLAAIEERT